MQPDMFLAQDLPGAVVRSGPGGVLTNPVLWNPEVAKASGFYRNVGSPAVSGPKLGSHALC